MSGVELWELPVARAARQGTGADGTALTPFLRMNMVLLAMWQYIRRAAARAPSSVPNHFQGSRAAAKALRRALKQQLTPSCCSQVLQRLAPAVVEVMPALQTVLAALMRDELCSVSVSDTLRVLDFMCSASAFHAQPFQALGKLQGMQWVGQARCAPYVSITALPTSFMHVLQCGAGAAFCRPGWSSIMVAQCVALTWCSLHWGHTC
jgi:hypothetical protein